MRTLRSVAVSLVVTIMLAMLAAPSASAASYIASPPMPELPLLELVAGGSVNFVGTIATNAGEAPSLVQVGLDFNGTLVFSDGVSPAAGTSAPYTIAVSTDVIIANCIAGSLTYAYWNPLGSSENFLLTVPCSIKVVVPATNVTPLLPTVQTEVCGPDNDVITTPVQPEGIVTADSGWIANSRTISFTAAAGYVIVGPAVVTLVDNAGPCPTVVVTTPTVEPTAEPTANPTVEPSVVPTIEPTILPTDEPTSVPVVEPTVAPPAVTALPSTGSGTASHTIVLLAVFALATLATAAGMSRRTMR